MIPMISLQDLTVKNNIDKSILTHSKAMRNLTKVWKTETGPSQGGRAWSRGPKSELFEILPYRVH